jgi:hypothetical protein
MSDADVEEALEEAGASTQGSAAALEANSEARLDGLRSALAILAILAIAALFFTSRIPRSPPGAPSG